MASNGQSQTASSVPPKNQLLDAAAPAQPAAASAEHEHKRAHSSRNSALQAKASVHGDQDDPGLETRALGGQDVFVNRSGNNDNNTYESVQQQQHPRLTTSATPLSSSQRPAKRRKPGDDNELVEKNSQTTSTAASSPPGRAKTPEVSTEKSGMAFEDAATGTSDASPPRSAYQQPAKAPVAHVTRNESSCSVASDISSASSTNNTTAATAAAAAAADPHEADPAMLSPVPKAFVHDVPPAPPSTPASSVSPSWDLGTDGGQPYTPLPIATVHNARLLEEQQMLLEGAATPAPQRKSNNDDGDPAQSSEASNHSLPANALPGEFEDWAVGDRYEMIRILGRGSYGEVAQALDVRAGRKDAFVAIKRIQSPFDQEVDAVRLYREMHILRHMRGHECIIQLLDIIQPPTDDLNDFHDLYLVFEYVDTDLYKLVMSPQFLTTQHIQTFLYQMLLGLKFIHSSNVIHRDLKPANILLNEDCSLKICDFGLARIVDSSHMFQQQPETKPKKKQGLANMVKPQMGLTRQLTRHVVTRWYRAPELILIQPYTSAVDIWSLGCILGELLSMQSGNMEKYEDRKPLFPGGTCFPLSGDGELKGDDKLDQLSVIFSILGTPSDEDISSIGKANEYIRSLGKMNPKPLEEIYPAADPAVLDLLRQMLMFNPQRRCTAAQALEHPFFNGVRNQQLERNAPAMLVGPEFLEKKEVDLPTVKQKTYEEVLWYGRRDEEEDKSAPKEVPNE